MKKIFSFAAFVAVMALTSLVMTSCLNDDSDPTIYSQDICTVSCDITGHYTFYTDNNVIVTLDNESDGLVQKVFGTKVKRASLLYQYSQSDAKVVNGVRHVDNAQVLNGTQGIDVESIVTKEIAESRKQLEKDSIFEISAISSFYAHMGYITCLINAPYTTIGNKSIYPDMTLVVDEADIKENEMTIHLYYNRHSAKDIPAYYSSTFAKSYPLAPFTNRIPGNGEITLKLIVEGQKTQKTSTYKMSRTDFNLPF